MTPLATDLTRIHKAGFGGIRIVTHDEEAFFAEVKQPLMDVATGGLFTWSPASGLWKATTRGLQRDTAAARDPFEFTLGLRARFDDTPNPSTICLFGLDEFVEKDPVVRRALIEGIRLARSKGHLLVLCGRREQVHPELHDECGTLHHVLPSREQAKGQLEKDMGRYKVQGDSEAVLDASSGLTFSRQKDAFGLAIVEAKERGGTVDARIVRAFKEREVGKKSFLTIAEPQIGFADLIGHEYLKQWLKARRAVLSPAARAAGLPSPKGVLFVGPPGTGKCHGKGTPILMYDGSVRPVEEVGVGDLVMGPDGDPRKVLSTTSGEGPLYKIVPNNGGESFVCNDEHILSLVDRRPKQGKDLKSWKGARSNISVKDFLRLSADAKRRMMLWRSSVAFSEQPLSVDPYILGLWLGDGHSATATLTTADAELAGVWCAWVVSNGDRIKVTSGGQGKAQSYHASKNQRGEVFSNTQLAELGVLGRRLRGRSDQSKKHIPVSYLTASRTQRLHLLAGLLDSDGYYDRNNRGFEFSQKLVTLANQVAFLARSLGFCVSQKTVTKKDQNGTVGKYQTLWFSGKLSEIPFRRTKHQEVIDTQKDVRLSGFVVEDLGEGEYFGFDLDGDHLYLLGDFTVTHNSRFVEATAKEWSVPWLTLDAGGLYGSLLGESEARLAEALEISEKMAPCVLLLDEVERGFGGGSGDRDGGTQERVLGKLLTWMASKTEPVFVVMTSNFAERLPAALVRKGRVDEIFCLDLPTDKERAAVFEHYLGKCQHNLKARDIAQLVGSTNGWVPSEIEACVVAARITAFESSRLVQLFDLVAEVEKTVPVSRSMAVQVENMRAWAMHFARKTSYEVVADGGERVIQA